MKKSTAPKRGQVQTNENNIAQKKIKIKPFISQK